MQASASSKANKSVPEVDGPLEAQDFVAALNADETHVVCDGLVRFVQATRGVQPEQEDSAVNEYLKLSPECTEIFSWWDAVRTGQMTVEKGSEGSVMAAIFDAFAVILFLAHPVKTTTSQIQVTRKLLSRTRFFNKFLESTRDQKLLRNLLKLLVAMVTKGAGVARELFGKLPFSSPSMLRLADKGDVGTGKNRTRGGTTRFGSTRHRFLQLTLALLEHGDVTTKKRVIEPKGVALAALRRIDEDPTDMVTFFLTGLKTFVLQDTAIGRKAKITFFGQPLVLETMLLPLYDSPHKMVRDCVHDFLFAAVVRPESSVFPAISDIANADSLKAENAAFNKRIESQLARRNRIIASMARSLNPVNDPKQRELLLAILELDDSLMEAFFATSWNKINLDPRPSIVWVRNVVFVRKLLNFPPPKTQNLEAFRNVTAQTSGDDVSGETNTPTFNSPAASKLDALANTVLACALPSATAVSRAMLSKGIQHSSSLVVVHTLDLLSHLLQRIVLVMEESLRADQGGAPPDSVSLRDTVGRKLVHRIPDVSVLITLVMTASQKHKSWQAEEAEWVLFKAARVMHWYGSLLPETLHGKLSVEKFLPLYDAPPSSVSLAAHISFARMFDAVGAANLAWQRAEALLRVCQLRCFCAQDVNTIDAIIENIFVSLVATSSYVAGRRSSERIHARAWAKAAHSLEDATFVARTITEAVTSKPFPSCDEILLLGLEEARRSESATGSKVSRDVMHRVVVELVHTLSDLSKLVPVLVEANLTDMIPAGDSILKYIQHVLGVPVPGAEKLSSSSAARTFVREVLAVDVTPKRSARAFRTSFGIALQSAFESADYQRSALIPSEGVPNARTRLLDAVDEVPSEDVNEIALFVSRAIGAFLDAAQEPRSLDAGPALELCMEILIACVDKDPECIVESLSGHSALRELEVVPQAVQVRLGQLFDAARNSTKLYAASISVLTSWVALFENSPNEDVACCLLLSRHCLVQSRLQDAAISLLDRISVAHLESEKEKPLSRALVLYALSHGPADAQTLLRLLQMADRQPGPDVDDALVGCCEKLVREHSLTTRASFVGAALQDPTSAVCAAASVLWTQPSLKRVHALSLLSGWTSLAETALAYLSREGGDIALFWEFLAHCPRRVCVQHCSSDLSKRIRTQTIRDAPLPRQAFIAEAKLNFARKGKRSDIENLVEAALDSTASDYEKGLALELLVGEGKKEAEEIAAQHAGQAPEADDGGDSASAFREALYDKYAGRLASDLLQGALDAASDAARFKDLQMLERLVDVANGQAQGRVPASVVSRAIQCAASDDRMMKTVLGLLESGLAFAAEAHVDAVLAFKGLHGNEALERIWLSLAQRLPASACPHERFEGLLASYKGTMGAGDCVRRCLIQIFEEQRSGSLDAFAYCIGERASLDAETIDVPCESSTEATDPVVLRTLLTSHFDWIFTDLDFQGSLSTSFPIFRSMSPQSPQPYCLSAWRISDLVDMHNEVNKRVHVPQSTKKRARPQSQHGKSTSSKRAKQLDASYEELGSDGPGSDSDSGHGSDSDSESGEEEEEEEVVAEDMASGDEMDSHAEAVSTLGGGIAKDLHQEIEALAKNETHSEAVDPSFALRVLDRFFTLHAVLADLPATSADEDDSDEDTMDVDENTGEPQRRRESLAVAFPSRRLIDSGVAAFCIWALSSFCEDVRRIAARCLQRFGQLLMRDPLFKDKKQFLLVLRYLRNALETGVSTRVSGIHCSFISHALDIVGKPSHSMYELVYRFLLRAPAMDLSSVPLFYHTFSSGTPNYRVERSWMVRVMEQGIRSRFDVGVLVNRHVPSIFMSFVSSPIGDVYMHKHVLEVLVKTARSGPHGARELVRAGVIGWATQVLAQSLERDDLAASALVDLIELLWHAAKVAALPSNADHPGKGSDQGSDGDNPSYNGGAPVYGTQAHDQATFTTGVEVRRSNESIMGS
ncbi:Nucleolar pre-ribosomal-associated protein 1 [Hondaea fermentalgiana]|uniref:Nucleolar pre-ribosomal-associated protein 1 n=1 Tax=Hondaea fermentalgiana TaxID=2315210 RepID=A0A2R5GE28_9STRA|nr:Nucleolar pre-ribosomal-associated protein 1 [Hondaea fermentalgiana]|eukprot:GBG29186.1 Nucleolar pre-ribosomal-associated protein 1 [Hondaea fermentalgiana]